jgi:two-component system, sensor histidine kinase and response regulator
VTESALPADGLDAVASGAELLDRAALEKVRAVGGPALVGRLIDMFLANAPERLARARAADGAGDAVALERAVHSLKSTAGNLGARRMQLVAEHAEAAAALGASQRMGPLLTRLEAVFDETRQILIQEREGLDR